ncbi:peptidylprolyl isomerase [Roseibium salinum]|uniref:Parvulin-like PPIase n=1 Tax=Roseibium salinum TaxID=1604349 RepID=A0ABT3QXS3_9HYPH|nr:peptidylprolyl isomerase [Roseibium sp. DSM 29163]MCX2721737.1 peptidylprolyl isomerase [Roseibium sp. DSM 29163]
MNVMRRILGEPLVQFLLIGLAVFGVYGFAAGWPQSSDPDERTIEVGPGRVSQLHDTFERTRQRPPTREELNGLIEAFVREEVYYREGRKIGLDHDDTLLRRRMQQKMEFLIEPSAAELSPSDAELEAHLQQNAADFRVPAAIAFRQVFLDPAKHGADFQKDAAELLARLEEGTSPEEAGDPTLLPPGLPMTSVDRIARHFGPEFAEALADAETGRWIGPIPSAFGSHLVLIEERQETHDPKLTDVRDTVFEHWLSAKRRNLIEERYRALRDLYEISVLMPEPAPELSKPAGEALAK